MTGGSPRQMTPRVAAAGALVVSLDSMVNLGFPAMTQTFGVPPEEVRWLIVAYVFTYAVMSFVGGAAADRLGHARVFTWGAGLTAVALLLGGLAPAFGWLVAGRVVQGLAAGLVYGTAPGIVTLAAPDGAAGRALGRLNAAIGTGFTLGAAVAGLVVDLAGWRAVFLVRVPLALAVLLLAAPARAAVGGARGEPRLVAGDVLRARVLLPGVLAFAANAGVFAVWLLAPFYLLAHRHFDARFAALLFTLTPFGTAVAAPLAGWAADRVGGRIPMATGLAVEAGGLLLLSCAGVTTPAGIVGLAHLATGFGLGFFQVPNMGAVMESFSAGQQGTAGGFTFLARTLGIVAGVLVLAQVFAARRAAAGFEPAFAEALVVAAVVVAVAAGLACAKVASG